jgi:hypothetical protein
MKLIEKVRDKGKIHRRYDTPKTPYQRLLESDQTSEETKKKLQECYFNLNPEDLKRRIDAKIQKPFKAYEEKREGHMPSPFKRQVSHVSTKSYILNGTTTINSVT